MGCMRFLDKSSCTYVETSRCQLLAHLKGLQCHHKIRSASLYLLNTATQTIVTDTVPQQSDCPLIAQAAAEAAAQAAADAAAYATDDGGTKRRTSGRKLRPSISKGSMAESINMEEQMASMSEKDLKRMRRSGSCMHHRTFGA